MSIKTGIQVLSNREQARQLIEALHARHIEQDVLIQLIASLANCLDRDIVIETMQRILGTDAIEKDECVLFDDIAVSFGKDGRVNGLYRIIDGSTGPAGA